LVNSLQDRLQWANGACETHWRHLLDSRLKERVITPSGGEYQSRAARKEHEQAIARRIARMARAERLEVWKQETGKSEPALYRRLKEVGLEPSHVSHFPHQAWSQN
jgi:hypothetical protein